MNNYPDDISNYDHDPRSPFYEEPPTCDECSEPLEIEVDADKDGYYQTSTCVNEDCPDCPNYQEPEEDFDEED